MSEAPTQETLLKAKSAGTSSKSSTETNLMATPINYNNICITCGSKDKVLVEVVRYKQTGKVNITKNGWICHECSYQIRNYGHVITDEEWEIIVANDKLRGGVNAL